MGQALPLFDDLFTSGVVQATEGDSVLVIGKAGLIHAKRAESCLLLPESGDTVLLALLTDGKAWVLAVLERQGKSCAQLKLPKHSTLKAQDLTLKAQKLSLEGETLGLTSKILTLSGQILLQGFSVIRTLASSFQEKIRHRLGHYDSLEEEVEGLAKSTAGRAQTWIKSSWRLRSENADLKAEKQVSIDADHIKVG